MAKHRTCPCCGKQYDMLAQLCVTCGVDLLTGKQHEAEVGIVEVDEDEQEATLSVPHRAFLYTQAALPGMFRPTVLIGAALVIMVGVGIMFAGLVMLLSFMVFFTGMMMAAAGVVVYAQAVAWIVRGEYTILIDALVEFDSTQWTIFMTLLALPPGTLGILTWLFAPDA